MNRKVRSNCLPVTVFAARLLAYLIVEPWLKFSTTGTANADAATSTANAANDAHATEHGLRCGDHLRGTDHIAERMSWTRLMHLLDVLVRGNAASKVRGREREREGIGMSWRRAKVSLYSCISLYVPLGNFGPLLESFMEPCFVPSIWLCPSLCSFGTTPVGSLWSA